MRTAKVIFGFSKRGATTEREPQQPHNVRNRIAMTPLCWNLLVPVEL